MLDFERQGRDEIAFVLDAGSAHKLTDEHNVLYIQGSPGDTMGMLGDWVRSAEPHYGADGRIYHRYTAVSKGETVEVYIDSDIVLVID